MREHHPRCHFVMYGGGECDCDARKSDTPRTDAADDKTITYSVRHQRVRELCEELERALAEAMRRIDMLAGSNADDYRWYRNVAQQAVRALEARHRGVIR